MDVQGWKKRMKAILPITLLFAFSHSTFADGTNASRMIATATISNLVSRLDMTATKPDVDAYANMLSDDFTITVTSNTPRGPLPQNQSKSDYVRDMRASIKNSQVLEAKTTIGHITIAESGTNATVNCTLTERTLMLDSKRICNLTMHQTFSLELRNGQLKIKKLESQIAGIKWE
jgi:hypothetical protein